MKTDITLSEEEVKEAIKYYLKNVGNIKVNSLEDIKITKIEYGDHYRSSSVLKAKVENCEILPKKTGTESGGPM